MDVPFLFIRASPPVNGVTPMATAYERLTARFQRLAQIDHALTILHWDQQVMMPPGGNAARATAMAELTALHHALLTGPEMQGLLEDAARDATAPDTVRSVSEMARVWREAACVPATLVKAKSLAGSRCEHGWRRQRPENDWHGFLENFRDVVALSREEARIRRDAAPGRYDTPYDALLDLYCTGEDSRGIRRAFDALKRTLPDIVQRASAAPPGPRIDGEDRYPVAAQLDLSRQLMARLGFDLTAGRLDVSAHPFSTGNRGDQRITTRFRDRDFADALQATAHEVGHAAYERGLPEKWDGLPIGRARNMCIHESQSLFFENHVFLSRPFFGFFVPVIHQHLPAARRFDREQLWTARVAVAPGLIRIAADEVTYPLHVILRFEIECDLINGAMAPDDIPEAWNEKMTDYLGISTEGNFTDGCLQDIHWTDGSFGYFPAYTMGAMNAAQIAAAIKAAHADWADRFAAGDVGFVRDWLSANIWRRGASIDAQQMLTDATGETTNPAHLLRHLSARYVDHAY